MSVISWPIAAATVRERGLAGLPLVIVALLVLLAVLFAKPDLWAGLWFELLTLLLGAGLLADEVESGHAQLVLLRPITRAQWVGGRLAGAALVIVAAAAAATSGSIAAAALRGNFGEIPQRAAVLPMTLLPALAWLATLTAVGAVARGWTNAGIVIVAWLAWKLVRHGAPLALGRPDLSATLEIVDQYVGPQELTSLPAPAHYFERALWNVFWACAAWLVAVRLFNLRELARRRP